MAVSFQYVPTQEIRNASKKNIQKEYSLPKREVSTSSEKKNAMK